LTGAYGESITKKLAPNTNIICVAGGTGITYVLPLLLSLARQPSSADRKVDLVWAIKHTSNVQWIRKELDILRKARKAMNLKIRIFATRDTKSPSTSRESVLPVKSENEKSMQALRQSSSEVDLCDCDLDVPVKLGGGSGDSRHPDLQKLITEFLDNTITGPTTIFASGPGGMLSDLRDIVATCNSPSKVWNGEEKFDVNLVYDDRLEW
jgi:ferric-chelate reductase